MEFKIDKFERERYVIVSVKGYVYFFTLKKRKKESIAALVSLYGKDKKESKWRYWRGLGFKCVKVTVNIEPRK